MTSKYYHTMRLRACYSDTDAGGAIYHARYQEFCERARWEMFLAAGIDLAAYARRGQHFTITQIHIDFKAMGRLGDAIDVHTRFDKIGRVSMLLSHDLVRVSDDVLLSQARYKLGYVDSSGVVRIPAEIVTALRNGADIV